MRTGLRRVALAAAVAVAAFQVVVSTQTNPYRKVDGRRLSPPLE
jgi:hypothetical protein